MTYPNEADIEMWEMATAAAELDARTSDRDTLLHPTTRRNIAEAGAHAGWDGHSVMDAIMQAMDDYGLRLSQRQQCDILADAGDILTRWELDEGLDS